MKNYLLVLFTILLAMCITTCQDLDKPLGPEDVMGVTINKESLTLNIGDKETLSATVVPPTAKNKTVIWSSSNEAVATVNSSGEVTARGEGYATITVTADRGEKAFCYITVTNTSVPATSITLNKEALILKIGSTETLIATITPLNTTDIAEWSSNKPEIATVDATGKVTTKAEGTATITATVGGKTASCRITVDPNVIDITSVTLNKKTLALYIGDKESLSVTIAPLDATDQTVTWRSGNEAIATVSNTGQVEALTEGTTTITATAGGKSDNCTVTVSKRIVPIISITLNKDASTLKIDATETLIATVAPVDATDKTISWTSNKPGVATVDGTGKVSAIAEGTATITAAAGGKTASCSITVSISPDITDVESVTLDKKTLSLITGDNGTLSATIAPTNATNKTVTWISGNESIATVSSSGEVTAKAEGTTTITATAGGKSDNCVVTVNKRIVPVTDIILNKEVLTLSVDAIEVLIATIAPDDASDKTITWSSNNRTIATVDTKGKVSALSEGTATITATAGDKTASCRVTVDPKVINVTGVAVAPKTLTLKPAGKETLAATVTPTSATDKTVTWISGNETIATVSSSGEVTAKAVGTTIITATAGDKSDICTVTVEPIPVTNITLNREALTLDIDATAILTATVKPDNATYKTITWSSNNHAIATVDTEGKVSAIAWGIVTITATAHNGVKATCEVTVNKPDDPLAITPDKVTLNVGNEQVLTVNRTGKTPVWSSDDMTVATVDASGKVKAIVKGTATITATVDGQSATCPVTVNTIDVTSVEVIPNTLTLIVNDSRALSVTVKPDNATDKNIEWTSSNPSVATVDNTGEVTAKAAGTATITATAHNGVKGTCALTVNPVLAISPNPVTLNVGNEQVLTVNITGKPVTWSSGNPAVATVDASGKVKAIVKGKATITALVDGLSATCDVTVSAIDVTKVVLNKTTLALKTNDLPETLTATVEPTNATDKKLTWTSSSPGVISVTVDEYSGIVTATAKSAGTAIITATAHNGVTGTCTVTVTPALVITPDQVTLKIDEEKTLMVNVDKPVEWSSSDPAIATVDASGKVKAIAKGTATIIATVDGQTAECVVTVNKVNVEKITLNKAEMILAVGSVDVSLTATIEPANATIKDVSWESTHNSTATVSSSSGVVTITAIAPGKTTIKASADGKTAECEVTVFGITPNSLSLNIDEEKPLSVTVTGKSPVWSSDNTSIAIVDASSGKVKGILAGTTKIKATIDGQSATCEVTVNNISAISVEVIPNTLTLVANDSPKTLTATVRPDNATDKNIEWTSSNDNIATVNRTTGVVTPKTAGTVTITATAHNGVKGTCALTVNPVLEITPNPVSLIAGNEQVLKVNITEKPVTWSSGSPTVATVDASGKVKAITKGKATITATVEGQSATCEVTVSAIDVTKVILNKTTLALKVNDTETLTATVEPSNATDKKLTWSSSNPGVISITVDEYSGIVTATAKSTGTATITATAHNEMKAMCAVTVTIPVINVRIIPDELILKPGTSQTLTATVEPSNATNPKLTWTSSSPGVISITVDEYSGIVTATAKSIGEATITATAHNQILGSCRVDVVTTFPIRTEAELLAALKTEKGSTEEYILMNNIYVSNWPIDGTPIIFRGKLDGNNHSINISSFNDSGYGSCYGGLLSYMGSGSVVKNLRVNMSQTIEATYNGDIYFGGITGYLDGGIIENCKADVYLQINNNTVCKVGGIAGFMTYSGTIQNCSVSGSIGANCDNNFVGGIVGDMSDGGIQSCSTAVSVLASGKNTSNYAGGIAGQISSGIVENCYTTGDAQASGSGSNFAGGIAGNTNYAGIRHCYTTGPVGTTGNGTYNYAGGIVGFAQNCTIQNCVALNGTIAVSLGSNYYKHRIATSSSSSISFNYGRTGMEPYPNSGWESYASSWDGADCENRPSEGWWRNTGNWTGNWDFNAIWQWDSVTNLPKLRNIP